MSNDIPDEVHEPMTAFLYAEAIPRWWQLPIPALDGRTPKQTWETDPQRVLELIEAYRTGAFM